MKQPLVFFFVLGFCLSYAQPNTEVFLFDLTTNKDSFNLLNIKNISDNEGYDNQPSFIDNTTLLYAGTRNSQTDIVAYTIENGSKAWMTTTKGSEYSPLKIPSQNAVSAIRLDPDGKQHLYRYDLKTSKSRVLMDSLVVGYHLWVGENKIIAAVLENDFLSLYDSNLETGEHKKIATHVGRSIHHIPNSDLISFISKSSSGASEIKSFNPQTKEIKRIAATLSDSEDLCWMEDGSILMAKDAAIFRLNPNLGADWVEIATLQAFNINNLSRLILSPDGKKLAIVGELSNQKLEAKLENIKWIAGNWKGEAFGGQTEENWSEPSGGSMMATFKLIENNTVVFYELEIIREVDNTLILQLKHFGNDLKGWEAQEDTIDFHLTELTTDKVVFEGMTFEKISAHEMNVYVDMKQDNGTYETVKFNYKK